MSEDGHGALVKIDPYHDSIEFRCPVCGMLMDARDKDKYDFNYCPSCGRELDWSLYAEEFNRIKAILGGM